MLILRKEGRATRDLLRRRVPLTHKRAARLAHVQHTNSQYNLPALGQKHRLPSQPRRGCRRAGRSRRAHRALRSILRLSPTTMSCFVTSNSRSSKPPGTMTPTCCICCTPCLASARFSASCCFTKSMQINRFPRDRISSPIAAWCSAARNRLANAAGPQAPRSAMRPCKWAFSEAAVLFLRDHPAAPNHLARLEKKHDTGQSP